VKVRRKDAQKDRATVVLFILPPSSFTLITMARKTILVVDDEKSQREILELILSGEGYDVTTASSGEAAINLPGIEGLISH